MKRKEKLNKDESDAVNAETAQVEIQNPKPLWIEKLNARLTDEFSYQLNEIMTITEWRDVNIGKWQDRVEFFEFFDRRIEMVYEYKEKPLWIRNWLETINPSGMPYPVGGLAKNVALAELPVLRQQVFLINALNIIIQKRFLSDHSLRLPSKILNDLLHSKIIEILNRLGDAYDCLEWNNLAKILAFRPTLSEKAQAAIDFLREILIKENLLAKSKFSVYTTEKILLFMSDQLTYPGNYQGARYKAFGDNSRLYGFCGSLYYEYYRLKALAGLERLEQSEDIARNSDKIQAGKIEMSEIQKQIERKELELNLKDNVDLQEIKQEKWVACALENADDPEQIGIYINEETKSRLRTSSKLGLLAMKIERLANTLEIKAEHVNHQSLKIPPPPDSKKFSPGYYISKPRLTDAPALKLIGIWKLFEDLNKLSDSYYNTHPLSENISLGGDDDQKATPANFYSLKRIKNYTRSLSDSQKEHRYLLSIKNAFLENEDKRGYVRNNGSSSLKADDKFLKKLEDELMTYERTSKNSSAENQGTTVNEDDGNNLNEERKRNQGLTTDRAILFLDFLFNYHQSDINKTKRAEAIHFLTGFSKDRIRQRLSTIKAPENTKKAKYKKDLRVIRKYFDELDLVGIRKMIDNELEQ
jgi:NOL1/NOP2/fmu family ribosome biogenesis protein